MAGCLKNVCSPILVQLAFSNMNKQRKYLFGTFFLFLNQMQLTMKSKV